MQVTQNLREELRQAALGKYFDARTAEEKFPESTAVLMPDGSILAASNITIKSEEGRSLHVSAEEALFEEAQIKYGDQIPKPVLRLNVEYNPKKPATPTISLG